MSDEGLMTAEIEGCLRVVIKALKQCGLPANDVIACCSAMLANDRAGCIARESVQELRSRLQPPVAK